MPDSNILHIDIPQFLPVASQRASSLARVLVADETLQIGHRPGSSGLAVISFSGIGFGHVIGAKGNQQTEEFVGTLADVGADDHTQIFVIDRKRSWLNGVASRLLPILRDATASERTVITLGNSMGGFAATWIAGQLPNCVRAIAMAPQFSVNPAYVPEEKLWSRYRGAIKEHRIAHAFEHRSDRVDYWAFFGTEKKADMRQATLFKEHGGERLRLVTVREAGHDVARVIKRARSLTPLIGLLLQEREIAPDEAANLLDTAGLGWREGVPNRRQERREMRRQARKAARQERKRRSAEQEADTAGESRRSETVLSC